MNKIEELKEIIAKNSSFAVISHLSPDGDNLGSIIAMTHYLESLGKKVYPIELDQIPEKFKFITDHISFYNEIEFETDVVIALDCANKSRLGRVDNLLNSSKYIIKIDHHDSGDDYATLNIVDSSISSTCEILTEILIQLEAIFTKKISTALLMGILTDTGRFLYDSVSNRTFELASFLIKNKAEKNLLMDKMFQSESLNSKRAQLEILKNANFYYNNNLVVLRHNKNLLESFNVSDADVENVINFYRESKEVSAVALIKEIDKEQYKISLRSKGEVNVCEICSKFGGGGHINAAGCRQSGPIELVINKIIEGFDEVEW